MICMMHKIRRMKTVTVSAYVCDMNADGLRCDATYDVM